MKEQMREALQNLLELYTSLVNCGDCGNWDVEAEKEVIAARAALSAVPANHSEDALNMVQKDPLDTAGNRHPQMRYAGYKGQPLSVQNCTADEIAAYDEGVRASKKYQQPAQEPVAWQSTREWNKKFITQSEYDSLSDEFKQVYMPFSQPAQEPVYLWRQKHSDNDNPWIDGSKELHSWMSKDKKYETRILYEAQQPALEALQAELLKVSQTLYEEIKIRE